MFMENREIYERLIVFLLLKYYSYQCFIVLNCPWDKNNINASNSLFH